MQSPFNWSEIDGITHIVFLPCSFAIRDIFLFAHYGFLQVRQVCARRKLAHPRIVASLQCRVCSRLSLQSNGTVNRLSHFSVYIRQDGITRISPILPCVLFPYISGFIASAFIRLVRFAHSANLRTLALSLRSNAVYATSFAPNSRKQRVIALFSAIWSERRDSNPQQPAWEAGILPLNYFRLACRYYITVPFILQ